VPGPGKKTPSSLASGTTPLICPKNAIPHLRCYERQVVPWAAILIPGPGWLRRNMTVPDSTRLLRALHLSRPLRRLIAGLDPLGATVGERALRRWKRCWVGHSHPSGVCLRIDQHSPSRTHPLACDPGSQWQSYSLHRQTHHRQPMPDRLWKPAGPVRPVAQPHTT